MEQSVNRQRTLPIAVARSQRQHNLRVLTSLPAGKMVPLAAIPLLREDALRRGAVRVSVEMMETVELLLNAVHLDIKAYLVPWLAFARFNRSMDQLNRSYEGQIPYTGAAAVPFFENVDIGAHGSNEVYKYLGMHAAPGTLVNTMYLEAYNAIWNFRARNRSPQITERSRLASTLAPAFWKHTFFSHIVPDFDQAVIDGEVPLNVVNAQLPVSGIGFEGDPSLNIYNSKTVRQSDGSSEVYANALMMSDGNKGWIKASADSAAAIPQVFAEMAANGITVSLSNLELARKTQAFAKLRSQFTEIAGDASDEWVIDLLMNGLSIPDQALSQPMLLGEVSTIFGQSKRYATDAANLKESAVNGATSVDLSFRVPQLSTGGVVVLTAEITPEQLYERQRDPFFFVSDVDELPAYLRDTLDPEKVEAVPNAYIDTSHTVPAGTFGYAPLNYAWQYDQPRIGGKFYRPTSDPAFDEDRQRLWAVETVDPVLGEDFYLCTQMHAKPFLVTTGDQFEAVVRGGCMIDGLTVFGGALIEANGDYDAILAEAPQERITK